MYRRLAGEMLENKIFPYLFLFLSYVVDSCKCYFGQRTISIFSCSRHLQGWYLKKNTSFLSAPRPSLSLSLSFSYVVATCSFEWWKKTNYLPLSFSLWKYVFIQYKLSNKIYVYLPILPNNCILFACWFIYLPQTSCTWDYKMYMAVIRIYNACALFSLSHIQYNLYRYTL